MPKEKMSAEEFTTQFVKLRREGKSYTEIGKAIGYTKTAVQKRSSRLGLNDAVVHVPPSEIDERELVARRKLQFRSKRVAEEKGALIRCSVNIGGPFGILFFGDPHVDDDGTDIEMIEHHARLTREVDGVFGATVGDITNNWIGRLARLYGDQSTTQSEALVLAEWFVKSVNWLFLVGGNHDLWSGAADPLKWIARQYGALYQSSEVRLRLVTPKKKTFTVNCRHDFKGHSMWNTAHGALKAAMLGPSDNVFICGHTHVSGYNIYKNENGVISHCIQVPSYKLYDRFAKDRGFRDQTISPGVLVVFNVDAETEADKVVVFQDVDRGCDYLTYLRGKK